MKAIWFANEINSKKTNVIKLEKSSAVYKLLLLFLFPYYLPESKKRSEAL